MKKEEIKQKVTDIIVKVLGVAESNVHDDAHIENDFGADSLDVLEMTMEAEKEFHIVLPDEEIKKVNFVRDFVRLVERTING